MSARRFEFQEGTSSKFWEVLVEGKTVTVRFGRIGTDGQLKPKKFLRPEQAQAFAQKLVREKVAKGYLEVSGASGGDAPAGARSGRPSRSAAPRPRFDRTAVRARVEQTHGLVLPDHVFDFVEWWQSRSGRERQVLQALGLELAGVLELCERHGLALKAPPGTDATLHGRYFLDPPEFLTVLTGDSDGLHFGLWFDDPRLPPAFVASYYLRDDPALHFEGPNLQAALTRRLETYIEDEGEHLDTARAMVASLGSPASPPEPPPYDGRRADAGGGVRLWVPGAPGKRHTVKDSSAEALVAAASRAMQDASAKDPARLERALAVGQAVYRAATREQRDVSAAGAKLLSAVYGRLGRAALARIVTSHHESRALASVNVLTRRPPAAAPKAKSAGPAKRLEVSSALYGTPQYSRDVALSPEGEALALARRISLSFGEKTAATLSVVEGPLDPKAQALVLAGKVRDLERAKDGWVAAVRFLRDGRLVYWRVDPRQDENEWHGRLVVSSRDGKKKLVSSQRLKARSALWFEIDAAGERLLLWRGAGPLELWTIPPTGGKWGNPVVLEKDLEDGHAAFLADGRIAVSRPGPDREVAKGSLLLLDAGTKKVTARHAWGPRRLGAGGSVLLDVDPAGGRPPSTLDLDTGERRTLKVHAMANGAALSPDGRHAALLGDRGNLAIADAATGEVLWSRKKFVGDALLAERLSFDSSGCRLIVFAERARQVGVATLHA